MANNIATTNDLSMEQQLQVSGQLMVDQAKKLVVNTHEDYEAAGKFLVGIKTRMKQVKDYWKKPKADAKAAHDSICAREKEMLSPLSEAESVIKKTMVAYQAAVEKARREAEEAARRRQQEETERLIAQAISAEESGNEQEAAINMAMAQMVEEMKPTQGISKPTATGTSIRKTWKARVVDPTIVPAYVNGIEIREIRMTKLNDLAKMTNGTLEIPGVEFYIDQQLSVRT